MAATLNAGDTIAGSLAECFVTIEGVRHNFMQMIDFEASLELTKTDVPILGKTGRGHKSTGWEGSFEGTAHYVSSVFRRMLEIFKRTGVLPQFEIQVVNEDPGSKAGRQTVILKQCTLDGGILAKFDADAEYLDEDIEGTFDDFDLPQEFTPLDGMM